MTGLSNFDAKWLMALPKIIILALVCFAISCAGETRPVASQQPSSTVEPSPSPTPEKPAEQVPVYGYEVVQSWPHDSQSFTQGLVFHDGVLYESAGMYGQSTLRRVELESGKVKKKTKLNSDVFAEGLTLFGDRLYQLTWTNQKGFIYTVKDFAKLGEFTYEGEGWGLTNDGTHLILSDGTNSLRFLEPSTGKLVRMVTVMEGRRRVYELNELEYIKGEVWANVWHTDRIARIDPVTGKLLGWIDLTGLLPAAKQQNAENVLNGIAYDAATDRIFVTGKRWSRLFEIRLKSPGNSQERQVTSSP